MVEEGRGRSVERENDTLTDLGGRSCSNSREKCCYEGSGPSFMNATGGHLLSEGNGPDHTRGAGAASQMRHHLS